MDKKEIISNFNSKDKEIVKDTYKYCINNNISLIDIIIEAIVPGYFGKEVLLSILIEGERKNEWLFPLLLKLLYNDPIYLNNILGYAFFEVIQRIIARSYRDDETCNTLLVNFILDYKLPQTVRSIGLDVLSLVHINDLINERAFNDMMNTIYNKMDQEIVTDFAIIATDNCMNLDFEKYYTDSMINKDIYPYDAYLYEKSIPYGQKKNTFLTKDFFKLDIDIINYIEKYLDK